ncbi:hypothetical protein GCM10009111_19670 [Colwellia asteriadis]|uniref:Flagellar basal-body/hook protein C-terminal domain-containing protein n=1 Tax=Colwellia asteriadis TaxID=517723 RepID=A0ABP3WHA7_9GAMM
MYIQSSFNSGIEGFQNARATADKAAADIAANTLASNEQAETQNVNAEVNTDIVSQATKPESVPDLNQSIVNLKVAEFQAKAATEVIKSADESLGTLIDVTA